MKNLILGLIIGIIVTACAGLPKFNYKYYALDAADYKGTLVGAKPKDDLDFSECKPTEKDKQPCVVMKREVFFQLKGDHIQGMDELIQCQRGN
jgi:hypothetical protein